MRMLSPFPCFCYLDLVSVGIGSVILAHRSPNIIPIWIAVSTEINERRNMRLDGFHLLFKHEQI